MSERQSLTPFRTKPKYIITDFFTNIDQVSKETLSETPQWGHRALRFFSGVPILHPGLWIVLILLGILSAAVAFTVDLIGSSLLDFRSRLASTDYFYLNLVTWVVYSIVFSLLAGLSGKFRNSDAEGSGIPEMKAVIAGVHIAKVFSFTTLFTKMQGLICATAGGLSIGREGPFVHISGIIANKLTKIKIFSYLHDNLTLRKQILGASVAAGVAATFGAPIGGVLFSVEVTATYYIVSNLWKGVFCSTICVVCFTLLNMTELTDLIDLTDLDKIDLNAEIFAFALLGLLAGIIGIFFIRATGKLVMSRASRRFPSIHSRFRYIFIVATLCALLTYSAKFLQISDKILINEMFSTEKLENNDKVSWEHPNVGINLLFYIVVKLSLTALSISCQIPCGVFTPVFAAGAGLGRFIGYLVSLIFNTKSMGVYAVVGAAALTSSVTHTISVVVIVVELTGQMHYILPMLVAVVISFAIANAFSMSIYDVLLEMKGLPYLPALKPSRLYNFNAKDIMASRYPCIKENGTLRDVGIALQDSFSMLSKVPVIDNGNNLIGDISWGNLKKYLLSVYALESPNLPDDANEALEPYFDYLVQFKDEEMFMYDSIPDHSQCADFWNQPIDFSSSVLSIDKAPFSIAEETPLAKVHFLFIMLGLMQIYVNKKGALRGIISRDSFINNS